jgi:hypothetical protein
MDSWFIPQRSTALSVSCVVDSFFRRHQLPKLPALPKIAEIETAVTPSRMPIQPFVGHAFSIREYPRSSAVSFFIVLPLRSVSSVQISGEHF